MSKNFNGEGISDSWTILINIIVENHGGNSSNGKELAKVLKNVNLRNCGSLPDFGNFCIQRENGSMYSGPCEIEYDKYQGMKDLMPYAKAVSVKSYDFEMIKHSGQSFSSILN